MFRSDGFVKTLTVVGSVVAVLYTIGMFICPWIEGGGDWVCVQSVWDRWQSLNVGMLAFVSSITALNISRFHSEKQRERDFLASKAFLPSALSELVIYLKQSATVFKQGWYASAGEKPDFVLPDLPSEYKSIFQECIRHASPDVGDYLSQILMRLQVHDARLHGYVSQEERQGHFTAERHNLIYYFLGLGEVLAMVNRIFDFSRGLSDFDGSRLTWE